MVFRELPQGSSFYFWPGAVFSCTVPDLGAVRALEQAGSQKPSIQGF